MRQWQEEVPIPHHRPNHNLVHCLQVYQTGDLANIDGLESELASKLPTLLQVRNAIYSSKFRNFIEQVCSSHWGTSQLRPASPLNLCTLDLSTHQHMSQ